MTNKKLNDLSTFFFIKESLKPYKWYFLVVFICYFLSGFHGTIQSMITKIIIDNVALPEIHGVESNVIIPSGFFILEFQLFLLLRRLINYITYKVYPKLNNDIISHAFEYIHRHPAAYFNNKLSGTIASDINILNENIIVIKENALSIVSTLVLILSSLICMYIIHPLFSLGLLCFMISFVSINIFFSKKINFLTDDFVQCKSSLQGNIVDSISNSQSVRLFAQKKYEMSYMNILLNKLGDAFQKRWKCLMNMWFIQMLFILFFFSFTLYILNTLNNQGLLKAGDFALILGLTLYMNDSLGNLTSQIETINSAYGSCSHSLKNIYEPVTLLDIPNASELIVKKSRIVFDNVKFCYPGSNIKFDYGSLIIEPGTKVGLVGYSGSGKSTFINLLLRFYALDQGKILIDNHNISSVTKYSLYNNFALIPQDPFLFHRSIFENIKYGNSNADQPMIIEAAKKAGAHEFIMSLPQGYDTLVGERGVKLSGGQRQRIAIARAIVRNPMIIIMDEATSQIDSITETNIQYNLNNITKDKTAIIISHRLSTLLKMDRILVFDQGKIVQDGTHEILIKKIGLYKTLWEAQVGSFFVDSKKG